MNLQGVMNGAWDEIFDTPSEGETTNRMPCSGSSSSGEYSGWKVIYVPSIPFDKWVIIRNTIQYTTHHENVQQVLEDEGFLDFDWNMIQRFLLCLSLEVWNGRHGADARVEGRAYKRGFGNEGRLG